MNKIIKSNIKNFAFHSFLLVIFVILMSGCKSDRLNAPDAVSVNKDWRAKIEALNSKYAQKAGMDISRKKSIKRIKSETVTPNGGENMPNEGVTDSEEIEGEENGDNGNNQANDQKAKHDKKIGITIKGALTGAVMSYLAAAYMSFPPVGVVAAVIGGAVVTAYVAREFMDNSSAEEQELYETYKEAQQEKNSEELQKTNFCDYTDFGRTVFYDDNIEGILGPRREDPDYIEKIFQGISTNKIEWADPIHFDRWYGLVEPFNDAIGVEVGPRVNFITMQMMLNPQMDKRDVIYTILENNLKRYDEINEFYDFYHSFEDIQREIENNIHNAYTSGDIDYRFNDILGEVSKSLDLKEYFDIFSVLDKSTQREYADAYTRIVDMAWNNGDISKEEALLINSTISTTYYQNLMWRPVVETPYTTDVRMAFDMENNKIYYCDESYLNMLLQTGQASFWGVPHFVQHTLTEVYFYGRAGETFSLPDVESITINDNTEYAIVCGDGKKDIGNIDEYHHTLMPCTYRVSSLERFDARFISAYKYNCY